MDPFGWQYFKMLIGFQFFLPASIISLMLQGKFMPF